MPSTQEITRRIKSVKSTRKVTRAMQMVSASKMRKAQSAALSGRPYSEIIKEIVKLLPKIKTNDFPLLQTNTKAESVLMVVISTNRGLVGSLNANLFTKVNKFEKDNLKYIFEYISLGKKAGEAAARGRKTLLADFTKDDSGSSMDSLYSLAKFITDKFSSGQYNKVVLVYSHFKSSISQEVKIQTLLPLNFNGLNLEDRRNTDKAEYLFEPSPGAVLEQLLPRALENRLRQAMLEAQASEHSARMLMMKNATDAAGDLVADLTLTYNQLRQNKITTELSEITAGRIALE